MKIGKQVSPHQAISASNSDEIIVRGHDLAGELIGAISFTEYTWLLVAGSLPTKEQRILLDAALVAIAEHGLVPSVQAARMTLAASPESVQGAVAAGLLGCGSVILGASEAAGRLFVEIVEASRTKSLSLVKASTTVLQEYTRRRQAIPGYGHPLHKEQDPRVERLLALAHQYKIAGTFCEVASIVEELLPTITGRSLAMNVSSAIPCVLIDAGYPLLALKGVPLLARTASLIGHLLEEQARPIGFVMSHAAAKAITYDGPAPDGFVASDH